MPAFILAEAFKNGNGRHRKLEENKFNCTVFDCLCLGLRSSGIVKKVDFPMLGENCEEINVGLLNQIVQGLMKIGFRPKGYDWGWAQHLVELLVETPIKP